MWNKDSYDGPACPTSGRVHDGTSQTTVGGHAFRVKCKRQGYASAFNNAQSSMYLDISIIKLHTNRRPVAASGASE